MANLNSSDQRSTNRAEKNPEAVINELFDRVKRSKPIVGNSTEFNFSRLNELSLDQAVELLRNSGFRSHPFFLTKFADYRLQLLENFHIQADIQKLERSGIAKETLAISLMAINLAPGLDHLFGDLLGNRRERHRHRKTLLAPTAILTQLEDLFGDATKNLPPERRPILLISGLKFYAEMLTWGERFYKLIGVNSISELAKYSLAGFVKRVTQKYHDREVSAVTGAALQNFDYDETQHRVWRIRNYKRLEAAAPVFPLFLQAVNIILSQK